MEFFELPEDSLKSDPGTTLEAWLADWQRRFVKDGGLNKENLEEFVRWAQDEYGVMFTHRLHY